MALLDLNTPSTTRLPLEPIKDGKGGYLYNGCIPTTIIEFSRTTQKHEKGEFAGMEVPVLAIELTNLKLKADEPDKFTTHYIKVVGSKQLQQGTQDVYVDREAKDIISDNNDMWKFVKHFLESLNGSPNFRKITDIPKADLTKYFDLPALGTPKERLEAYDKFFTYIANFVNGDSNERKSMIVDANGRPINLWIKMLPNFDKDPKRNAKFYSISRFIGNGVFEQLKIDATSKALISPRIIRVKPTESLELLATTSTRSIANGGTPSGISGGEIPPDINDILNGKK